MLIICWSTTGDARLKEKISPFQIIALITQRLSVFLLLKFKLEVNLNKIAFLAINLL